MDRNQNSYWPGQNGLLYCAQSGCDVLSSAPDLEQTYEQPQLNEDHGKFAVNLMGMDDIWRIRANEPTGEPHLWLVD